MTLNYLPDDVEVIEKPLWWHNLGLQQTASGYGNKLISTKMVKWNGRMYRVYVMCYSNNGTAYIVSKGEKWILQ